MIEIYRRKEGKDRLICVFDTFDDLFCAHRVDDDVIAAAFGRDPEDRTEINYLFGEKDDDGEFLSHHVYVCYENDKLVTPDRLVGHYRTWVKDRPNRWNKHGWHAGKKKYAYGHWRSPKTANELRWAHAWDDEEYAPKTGFTRGRRRAHALPTLWDDCMTYNDKSWKTQSKRRHQWKPKKGV